MSFVDRTTYPKSERGINRSKFLDRAEKAIKKGVKKRVDTGDIKDLVKGKRQKIKVKTDDLDIYSPQYDRSSGDWHIHGTGNDVFDTGDQLWKPDGSPGTPSAGNKGEGEMTVELDDADMEELFFNNLILPYMYKQNEKLIEATKWRRAGYQNRGNPTNINYIKTMENLLTRQIIYDDDEIWLEDVDVKFNSFIPELKPSTTATLFCVMDVSGSMTRDIINTARQFYFLLCMFLQTKYKDVEIRFIRYHTTAHECEEEEFFYGKDTGGTLASEGLKVLQDILDNEYDISSDNIYVALASDGDSFEYDLEPIANTITENLDWYNYFCYLQIKQYRDPPLLILMQHLAERHKNIGLAIADEKNDVYNCLIDLFKKDNFEE